MPDYPLKSLLTKNLTAIMTKTAHQEGVSHADQVNASPAVTVLMPVHNGLPFVEEALRSIMNQTFKNIEILVIDDASTDNSANLLSSMAAEDARIRIETLKTNHRLPRALNHGLTLARAPLIARMDADDIAMPNRLEVQKAYMDLHPEVVLTGGGVRRIRADGTTISENIRARDDFALRWLMKFRQSILHPTWMMRNPRLSGFEMTYNPEFTVTEDHEFLSRMLKHGKIVGLRSLLLQYRVHESSITSKNWGLQKEQDEKIFAFCVEDAYPREVLSELGAVRAAHFRRENAPAQEIIAGFLAILAHDVRRYPDRRAWLRRQTAQLVFETLKRAGYTTRESAMAILRYAPSLSLALGLRAAESQNLLPRFLDSEPDL